MRFCLTVQETWGWGGEAGELRAGTELAQDLYSFPAFMADSSQSPAIPAPEDPMSSSGLNGHPYTRTHTHTTCAHVHTHSQLKITTSKERNWRAG